MTVESLQTWFARLRTRGNLANTVSRFAQAVGEVGQAQTVGVFLLDYLGQSLLLFASWSKEDGPLVTTHQAVPMTMLQDPLCFALQEGKPYQSQIHASLPAFPSLGLLPNPSRVQSIVAAPLQTWNNTSIGGIIVGYGQSEPTWTKKTATLVDFGALLLDGIIRQQKDHVLLNSLCQDIRRLDGQIRARQNTVHNLLIGRSTVIVQVRDQITKAGSTDLPILITGETGTGKELAASAIHAASPRCNAPFIKINCGALPAPLLESELFGHKKGAFSGATSDHIGLLRSAAGGTVLLDEIGEMPLALQVKLLRVVQDYQVRPVGHVRSYPVNIRIISATNANMEDAIANNRFRPDLYHRLQGFRIHMPPLRQRLDDIPLLTSYFLQRMTTKYGRPTMTCHPDAMQLFLSQPFPGNVRQLFAELEQAVLNAGEGIEIQVEHFLPKPQATDGSKCMSLQGNLAVYEKMLIESVISSYNGNITKAAQALGIPRTTLSSKLRKNENMSSHLVDNPGLKRDRKDNASEPIWTSC